MVLISRSVSAFSALTAFSVSRNSLNASLSCSSGAGIQFLMPSSTCARLGTSFYGKRMRTSCVATAPPTVTKMAIDPWSVSPEFLDVLAAQSFAASLFPYLAFLYFLGKEKTDCPKLANFGFQFLLAFVGASIPAGIWAKVHYNDILANIDWLHGSAESLLTVTNLLIVVGFQKAFLSAIDKSDTSFAQYSTSISSNWGSAIISTACLVLLAATPLVFPGTHPEPANALSYPTWIIHISSLFEWLAAMGLVWTYADLTGNKRWRGLTWGMLPLHTSGLCACTYHMFYNAPSLNILVALQAALTFFGNCTMCWAAYRIFKDNPTSGKESDLILGSALDDGVSNPKRSDNIALDAKFDPEPVFLAKLLVASALGSAVVKWGELYFDAPFNPTLAVALAFILVPTSLNIVKWAVRSDSRLSSLSKIF